MYYNPYDRSYWRARPTEKDFVLDVVSKHPDFNGRNLRKHLVDGIDSVGVWGDEPFEIHFHNKSFEDVQLRLSLDGTDVLTGKAADLEVNHQMWLVRAGRTLHLKAWAENNQGGARFVFTTGENSVALHAHGDVSHKGIISAAVFTERYQKPIPVPVRKAVMYSQGGPAAMSGGGMLRSSSAAPTKGGQHVNHTSDTGRMKSSGPISASNSVPAAAADSNSASFDFMNVDRERSMNEESFRKEASVGAGEYTAQKTHTVKGLDSPVLHSIVRVRYMWWDDMQARLREEHPADPHPTGFPAEKIKTFADLSGVPRVTSVAARTEALKTPEKVSAGTERVFDRVV